MAQQLVDQAGASSPVVAVLGPIKERIDQAKRDRSRIEPVWHSNRAYGAGKHWLKWSRSDRRLRLDPRDVQEGAERYTVDILTQNIMTALGQMAGAEERRQLLFRREDIPSEDFTKAANDALAYGWEHEWRAPEKLNAIKRKLLVDGTAAIQCYYDPTVGKELGNMPLGDGEPFQVYGDEEGTPPEVVQSQAGQPIVDGLHARAFMQARTELGITPQMKHMREGRICWHPLSVFQLLVPPGIEDEQDFPWEAVIQAVQLDKLVERFGSQAKGIKEEPLAVLEQIGLKDSIDFGYGSDPEGDPGTPGKLDGHAALVTYYERPSTRHPRGRVVSFAGERMLETVDELPYVRPNGDYHSGLVYFHYWRVEGRFWGRALIEGGKGIQRTYNKRIQQEDTTIRRGQPYILAEDSDDNVKKTEAPLEIVAFPPSPTRPPVSIPGIPVHESIWRSKEGLLADIERALGVHAVSTGEAPQRQTTYAELALRAEKDRTKLDPITADFQHGVAVLTELSIYDIRRYWSADKMIAISGEEDTAEAVSFQASKLPEFFLTELAEGSKPRTQAAEISLVMELWQADQANPDPMGRQLDLSWLAESLKAGKALDFPESDKDIHEEKARWENTKLIAGEQCEPAEYDPPDVHIPIHRETQVEAEMAGDADTWDIVEEHVQLHVKLADHLATRAAAEQAQSEDDLEAAQGEQMQVQEEQSAEADQARQLELQAQQQEGAP